MYVLMLSRFQYFASIEWMMNFQLERCKLEATEVRMAWIVLYIANTWAKCDDTVRLKYQQQQYIWAEGNSSTKTSQ